MIENPGNETIIISDDSVTIRASEFIKHDGYTHHLPVLIRVLYDTLTTSEQKKILFRFDDGEPVRIVAFDQIISDIADMLGIEKTNILFEVIDHVPRVSLRFPTKIAHSRFFSLAEELIKSELCVLDQHCHMFGAFFGRFTLHRMMMAYFLETNFPDISLVTFQPKYKWAEYEIGTLKPHFSEQMIWLESRREKNADLSGVFNGCVSASDCLPVYHEIFGKYAIEIVIETNVYDMGWFTEKTTKCLAAGKPFILLGTQGQLQQLRNMGFRTFDGIIDEKYDLEPNVEKRFDMICAEIKRLARLSTRARASFINELYKISEYNKNNYSNIIDNYYQKELL